MQNWSRLYSYISEYHHLVYDYYSKIAVAFLTNYYNINKDQTIWDTTDLLGGAYERIGDLSGIKYDKYLLLPVYFSDEYSTSFDGQDIGQVKENILTVTIPSSYGLTPLPGDMVKFDQTFLRETNNIYPTYIITGVDIHPNTDARFWKLKLETNQSITTDQIDTQVNDIYVFFDYDKTIHPLAEATQLAQLLSQNEELADRIGQLWDPVSGFYTI